MLHRRRAWRPLPVLLWALGVGLLSVWVALEVRAGVRADEAGTSGSIGADGRIAWWGAAVLAAVAATAVGRQRRST